MTSLFGRTWALQVNTLELSDLDLMFSLESSIYRSPNVAEIRIFNLSPESRATVERGGAVLLAVGLGTEPHQIFRGDARWIWTEREGPDFVTIIQARDGGRAYSDARVSRSWGPGTPVVTVVRDLAAVMGVGEGNLSQLDYALRNGASTFADGFVGDGRASRVLHEVLRGAGYRWSIQRGALQILSRTGPLQVRAVALSADSGLIESPTWDERGQRTRGRRGLLKVKALIQPGLEPGRKVRVESALVQGDFEIRKAVVTGDTRGNDWYSELELRPIS
jgi:hypothetical protein